MSLAMFCFLTDVFCASRSSTHSEKGISGHTVLLLHIAQTCDPFYAAYAEGRFNRRNTEVKMAEVRVVHALYMCLERRGLLTRVGRFPAPAMIVK